ncbi:MAG TPA: YraN family protein [Cytophagaceae bacterium]|nr:YraN family protein [Cytophagaceae bacterium]
MKTKAQSGREGEEKAANYLKAKGWQILAQNYRYKRGELDIIGIDKDVLVFVEVKFRKNNLFGFPEEFVGDHKIGMLRKTALEYVVKENWEKDIRFDIIAITGSDEPEHFEDAF